jgi:hypothetical protein
VVVLYTKALFGMSGQPFHAIENLHFRGLKSPGGLPDMPRIIEKGYFAIKNEK